MARTAPSGEGRMPSSHERRGFRTPIVGPAVAGIGDPAATINAADAGRQPAFSVPMRHPITLPCSSLPFFQ